MKKIGKIVYLIKNHVVETVCVCVCIAFWQSARMGGGGREKDHNSDLVNYVWCYHFYIVCRAINLYIRAKINRDDKINRAL